MAIATLVKGLRPCIIEGSEGARIITFVLNQYVPRVSVVSRVEHVEAEAEPGLKRVEVLRNFIFEVANLVDQLLLFLLLLVFVVIDTLLQGQLRLLKPSQSIRVFLHVPLKVLKIKVRLSYRYLIENALEVL